jgi:hypothetical protein
MSRKKIAYKQKKFLDKITRKGCQGKSLRKKIIFFEKCLAIKRKKFIVLSVKAITPNNARNARIEFIDFPRFAIIGEDDEELSFDLFSFEEVEVMIAIALSDMQDAVDYNKKDSEDNY